MGQDLTRLVVIGRVHQDVNLRSSVISSVFISSVTVTTLPLSRSSPNTNLKTYLHGDHRLLHLISKKRKQKAITLHYTCMTWACRTPCLILMSCKFSTQHRRTQQKPLRSKWHENTPHYQTSSRTAPVRMSNIHHSMIFNNNNRLSSQNLKSWFWKTGHSGLTFLLKESDLNFMAAKSIVSFV